MRDFLEICVLGTCFFALWAFAVGENPSGTVLVSAAATAICARQLV